MHAAGQLVGSKISLQGDITSDETLTCNYIRKLLIYVMGERLWPHNYNWYSLRLFKYYSMLWLFLNDLQILILLRNVFCVSSESGDADAKIANNEGCWPRVLLSSRYVSALCSIGTTHQQNTNISNKTQTISLLSGKSYSLDTTDCLWNPIVCGLVIPAPEPVWGPHCDSRALHLAEQRGWDVQPEPAARVSGGCSLYEMEQRCAKIGPVWHAVFVSELVMVPWRTVFVPHHVTHRNMPVN